MYPLPSLHWHNKSDVEHGTIGLNNSMSGNAPRGKRPSGEEVREILRATLSGRRAMHKTTSIVDRYRDRVELSPKRSTCHEPNQRALLDVATDRAEPRPPHYCPAPNRPPSPPRNEEEGTFKQIQKAPPGTYLAIATACHLHHEPSVVR